MSTTFGFLAGSKNLSKLFVFPERFLFYMGMIVSIVMPNLVPLQRIDDCVEIHILHLQLCDPLLSNHQNCPLWARLYQCVF